MWLPLEKLLRSWAVNFTTIHVILGSVLDADRDGERDKDADYVHRVGGAKGVAIPSHFYAVVVRCINDEGLEPADCDRNQLDALGLLFQHSTEPGVSLNVTIVGVHLVRSKVILIKTFTRGFESNNGKLDKGSRYIGSSIKINIIRKQWIWLFLINCRLESYSRSFLRS